MTKLQIAIIQACHRNRDGSYMTQRDRKKIALMIGRQLYQLGYKDLTRLQGLKGRHIFALLDKWNDDALAVGTVKNRMSALRWLADKGGKSGVIPRANAALDIPNRDYIPTVSKAFSLEHEHLESITDPHVSMAVQLMSLFGLRRAEAMKFQVAFADKENHIFLKPSWCKGGRSRPVVVRNIAQRRFLDKLHGFSGKASLIPAAKSYIQQVKVFERQTFQAGIGNTHGLRHNYAQTRYFELTGWKCPLAGGKHYKELTEQERIADRQARLTISAELGHARIDITNRYLGR